jgi:coenzyme F420 biosynthesis associated uncharacterized protein
VIDWGVARQVARFASRTGPMPDLGVDLPALARELEGPVGRHTGLTPAEPVPPVEVVARDQWAQANLDTLSDLLDPVAVRMERRFEAAGPFAGALRTGAGVTMAAEVGLVTGFLSQHVLGQYELSLLALHPRPRLLMVAPNLDQAGRALGADRESFLRWVTIHELVHAFQFGGVTWLRDHLGGLLREYLETVDVQISSGAAGGLPSLPNPSELVGRFQEGGLAALVQTPDQRQIMDRVQTAMAVIEGHAEHVMDALASELVPHPEGLRQSMERRRASRSAPQRILLRLLGMEMKMRQYREGKAFCDAVAREGGTELLNRVWQAPAMLPTAGELARPQRWISRVAP